MENKKWQKQLHEQIGSIIHNHAKIEYGISVWTTRLISDNANIGFIVTSEMSYKSLIKAFQALIIYKAKHVERIKVIEPRIKALVRRINNVEQQRNKFAHSSMLSLDGEKYIRVKFSAKEKHGLKFHQENFGIKDLESINKEQELILEELGKLFELSFEKTLRIPRKVIEERKKG